MEQMKGIEPSCRPWQGRVLPLNYICIKMAVRTGLEPAISSVTGRHVNHYTNRPLLLIARLYYHRVNINASIFFINFIEFFQ